MMPTSPQMLSTLVFLALGLVAGGMLGGCKTPPRTAPAEVRWLVDHGRFADAVQVADKYAREHPGDAAADELHRDATLAYVLEEGRRHTLRENDQLADDQAALECFQRALELDPTSHEAQDWVEKTRAKLGIRWFQIAYEHFSSDQLPEALVAYDNMLLFMPESRQGLEGKALVSALVAYRASLGLTYFDDGLRALSEYWLEQARSRFTYSGKYQPDDERTRQRTDQVNGLLAVQRLSLAERFEQEHRFGAARNEYRIALMLDPTNKALDESVARCRREMQAVEKLKSARMEIVRGRFAKAVQLVAEARKLTTQQGDMCDGVETAIRDARLEKAYRAALALERDYRYPEAVASYDELLQQTEYYKDVITRRDTLQEYVRLAGDLYAKVQTAETPEKKLESLRQIRVFWPEYLDVATQLESLEKLEGK